MTMILLKVATTMKTRSQRGNVEVIEVVEVGEDFDSDGTNIIEGELVDSSTEASLGKTPSIPKALRRIDQNAHAAFRLSVVKAAVKELKQVRAKNGGRAIYGDFKMVLQKYEQYKFVTRAAVIYRLKLEEMLVVPVPVPAACSSYSGSRSSSCSGSCSCSGSSFCSNFCSGSWNYCFAFFEQCNHFIRYN